MIVTAPLAHRLLAGGRRRGLAVVVTGALVLGCAACSSSSSPGAASTTRAAAGGPAAPSGQARITISNFAFGPSPLRVAPGSTVTVVNDDAVAHTVTSTTGAFDTGDVQPGRTAHFTAPSKPGTYPYRCTIHQFMTGTLVVTPG